MYKCIIIDDEQHAIDGLKAYLASTPQLNLIANFTDPVVAWNTISQQEPVDLIFLDIDMPKINGIELAKEIRSKTNKLIFTTGHTKYAFDAFEANADAYLLKPYSLGKFIITINKLFPIETTGHSALKDDFFFVKSKEDNLKITKIRYEDIINIESRRNDVMIHTLHKKVLTHLSLTEVAKLLQDIPGFVQWHRSFIIKLDHIESINGNQMKMVNGMEITVGEQYRKEFNAFVSNKLIRAGKKLAPPQ